MNNQAVNLLLLFDGIIPEFNPPDTGFLAYESGEIIDQSGNNILYTE